MATTELEVLQRWIAVYAILAGGLALGTLLMLETADVDRSNPLAAPIAAGLLGGGAALFGTLGGILFAAVAGLAIARALPERVAAAWVAAAAAGVGMVLVMVLVGLAASAGMASVNPNAEAGAANPTLAQVILGMVPAALLAGAIAWLTHPPLAGRGEGERAAQLSASPGP